MRILFAGTPAIALPSLRMLAEGALSGRWVLAGILTNPDKPRGRGRRAGGPGEEGGGAEPSEVGRAAAELAGEYAARGLAAPAILKPETLKAEAREAAAALKPDLLVTFAYGRIFGPRFLGLFPLGGINVHPSLLPKYRGASPIQEAILRRDPVTGITIQRIALEMDEGNILARREIPLTGGETAGSLGKTAALEGSALLWEVMEDFLQPPPPEGVPQRGEASYCARIGKDSGLIDWSLSALEIGALIRAYQPWPLARTVHQGRIINILEAAPWEGEAPSPAAPPGGILGIDKKCGILIQTGKGVLAVSVLQYQARKALPWRAFLNGARDFIGSRL
ncbi:MAG: methionyl-tRNA formyltransferase [Treponema sp.]|jgi:methionyl-tRNA formyltransferase|nr:methionyl-tRNA formyltransferase [Treponema sp.]